MLTTESCFYFIHMLSLNNPFLFSMTNLHLTKA